MAPDDRRLAAVAARYEVGAILEQGRQGEPDEHRHEHGSCRRAIASRCDAQGPPHGSTSTSSVALGGAFTLLLGHLIA